MRKGAGTFATRPDQDEARNRGRATHQGYVRGSARQVDRVPAAPFPVTGAELGRAESTNNSRTEGSAFARLSSASTTSSNGARVSISAVALARSRGSIRAKSSRIRFLSASRLPNAFVPRRATRREHHIRGSTQQHNRVEARVEPLPGSKRSLRRTALPPRVCRAALRCDPRPQLLTTPTVGRRQLFCVIAVVGIHNAMASAREFDQSRRLACPRHPGHQHHGHGTTVVRCSHHRQRGIGGLPPDKLCRQP